MKNNKGPKKAKINCRVNQRGKKNDIKNEILDSLHNRWPEERSKKEIMTSLSDKEVRCADGTFYNVISELIRENRVISNRSSGAKYKYNKSKNENYPTGDINSTILTETGFVNTIMELIRANSFEDVCRIHDIHLKTDFWNIEAFQDLRKRSCKVWHHERCYPWKKNKKSKSWKNCLYVGNSHKVTFQIYSTGVLTCSIKCTRTPFLANFAGLRALHNVINEACLIIFDDHKFWTFPIVDNWIVTLWHYGRDTKLRFTCRFEVTFRNFFGGFARIYVRKEDGRLRVEESQSPCETLGLLLHKAEIGVGKNIAIYGDEKVFLEFEKRIKKIVKDKIREHFTGFMRFAINSEN